MSEETVLPFLPWVRCDICMKYLSSGPAGLMPSGYCIGGCGPAPEDNIQIHQVQLLNETSFPCKFSNNGCTMIIPFGQTAQHEDGCIFQSHVCPANLEACLWKGPAMKMYKHFEENHPGYIQQNAEFKIDITKIENTGGIFMVAKDSVGIIVKYFYTTAEDNDFVFDVRYCAYLELDVSLEIEFIITDIEQKCSFKYLLPRKCLPYDSTFFDDEHTFIVRLIDCLELLNSPDDVTVVFNLAISF